MAGRLRMRFVLAVLFGTLLAFHLWGDELSAWFDADPRARTYAEVRAELEGFFSAARLQNVPIAPLIDKLREGASKGVDAGRLLDALRDTIDRLLRARSILEQASGASASREEDVQAVSLLLLRGLPEEVARKLIAYGLQAGRSLQVTRSACDAVASLMAVAEDLGDQDALKIGSLLLASRLPASAYGSLTSIFQKAKASGLDEDEILLGVIIGSLESGGGIVAMEEKINRGQAAKERDKKEKKDKPDRPDKPDKPDKK